MEFFDLKKGSMRGHPGFVFCLFLPVGKTELDSSEVHSERTRCNGCHPQQQRKLQLAMWVKKLSPEGCQTVVGSSSLEIVRM